jgi:hypothetical protein
MKFIANGIDTALMKDVLVGKRRRVEMACPSCGEVYQAKEYWSLADLVNKCHDQRKVEKVCVCERIDSISVGYVPSWECFGCDEEGDE